MSRDNGKEPVGFKQALTDLTVQLEQLVVDPNVVALVVRLPPNSFVDVRRIVRQIANASETIRDKLPIDCPIIVLHDDTDLEFADETYMRSKGWIRSPSSASSPSA